MFPKNYFCGGYFSQRYFPMLIGFVVTILADLLSVTTNLLRARAKTNTNINNLSTRNVIRVSVDIGV